MELWRNFKEFYSVSFKEVFDNLCTDILKRHFPNKKIINANELDKVDKEKINGYFIVFVSKFFTDALTDSRKSQIRNVFNKTEAFFKDKLNFYYTFAVCSPYILSEKDKSWWVNWKHKKFTSSGVMISFFEGDFIIELAKKYGVFDKYFNFSILQNDEANTFDFEISEQSNDNDLIIENLDVEVETPILEVQQQEKEKEQIDKNIQTPQNQEDEKSNSDEHSVQSSSDKEQENQLNIEFARKLEQEDMSFDYFKQLYDEFRDKVQALDKLKLKKFKDYRKDSLYDFNEFFTNVEDLKYDKDDEQILNILPIKYLQKANISKVNKRWDKVLFYIEKLKSIETYKTVLQQRLKDIEKLCKLSKDYSQAILNLFYGDYYLTIEDKDFALKNYEKAYKLYPEEKEIIEKYFSLLGDIALEKEEFEEAEEYFSKAYNARFKTELKNKKIYSEYLKAAEKRKALQPFKEILNLKNYILAEKYYKSPYVVEKIANSSLWIIFGIVLLFLVAIFVPLIFKSDQPVKVEVSHKQAILEPTYKKLYRYAENVYAKTDEYPHLYDSALVALDSALKIIDKKKNLQNKKQLKTKYLDLKKQISASKKDYIQNFQNKININPEAFMISMRDYSEGLKFVKFLKEPFNAYKGKYGYINKQYKIVVPPYFDYDYKKLEGDKVQFKNDTAWAAIKFSDGNKYLVKINKKGKIIDVYDKISPEDD